MSPCVRSVGRALSAKQYAVDFWTLCIHGALPGPDEGPNSKHTCELSYINRNEHGTMSFLICYNY